MRAGHTNTTGPIDLATNQYPISQSLAERIPHGIGLFHESNRSSLMVGGFYYGPTFFSDVSGEEVGFLPAMPPYVSTGGTLKSQRFTDSSWYSGDNTIASIGYETQQLNVVSGYGSIVYQSDRAPFSNPGSTNADTGMHSICNGPRCVSAYFWYRDPGQFLRIRNVQMVYQKWNNSPSFAVVGTQSSPLGGVRTTHDRAGSVFFFKPTDVQKAFAAGGSTWSRSTTNIGYLLNWGGNVDTVTAITGPPLWNGSEWYQRLYYIGRSVTNPATYHIVVLDSRNGSTVQVSSPLAAFSASTIVGLAEGLAVAMPGIPGVQIRDYYDVDNILSTIQYEVLSGGVIDKCGNFYEYDTSHNTLGIFIKKRRWLSIDEGWSNEPEWFAHALGSGTSLYDIRHKEETIGIIAFDGEEYDGSGIDVT